MARRSEPTRPIQRPAMGATIMNEAATGVMPRASFTALNPSTAVR